MQLKKFSLLLFLGILFSCSSDTDITTPRNLQEYLEVNNSLVLEETLAFGVSNITTSTLDIYFFPTDNAKDIRFYVTDSINQNKTDFSLYKRELLPQINVFNKQIQKFIRRNSTKEKWCLITFKTSKKLYKSLPIKIKNRSQPTEWKDTIRIEYPQTLQPKFSWDDGNITENIIYFETLTDNNNKLLSATYTTDKWFQYYNTSNVTLNITPETPPALIKDDEYIFTVMGIDNDNWVNLLIKKTFIVE